VTDLVITRLTQEIDEEILRMGNDEIKARARAIDNEIKVRLIQDIVLSCCWTDALAN
jgi:hypothetical protein